MAAEKVKIAIVGSGPAGLSAGARAASLGLSHVVLEKTDHPADTIHKFQKAKPVMSQPADLPLRSDIAFGDGLREEVLRRWQESAAACGVSFRYNAEVTEISGQKGAFTLTLADGGTLEAEYVVLAIGLQGNINKMRCPGGDLPHIQYQLDDPDEYEHERIVVIGGGDAAIENAVALCGHNTVYILNRSDEYARAKGANEAAILDKIDKGQIIPLHNADTVRCDPGSITVKLPEGEETVAVDRVIARIGAAPPRKFVEACGVVFPSDDRNALPEVSGSYESNVPGLHIVGSLAGYPLIKQGLNQGYEVVEYINGNRELEPADEPKLREKLGPDSPFTVDGFLEAVRARVPIFAELNPLMLRETMLESSIHQLEAGALVFRKNDYTNSFYTIVEGSVRISLDDEDPSKFVVLEQGAFFGEMGLISGRRRSATVHAHSDCVLMETPRRTMIKLRNSVPSVRETMDREAMVRQIQAHIAPSIDREAAVDLAAKARIESYAKGEVLFREGEAGDSLHLVRRGSVVVTKRIGGRDVTLSYRAAGNYVGEMALIADAPRSATVKAAVDSETIRIDRESFNDLLARYPSVRADMDALYRERLVDTERREATPDAGGIIEFLIGEGVGEATDILLIDETLCIGCDNCEKACAETHGGISRLDREAGPTFAAVHVPTSCRHCEHPHCMSDCPPDAIKRAANGEVYITDACIGCGNCERNCPYGVIQMAAPPPKKPGLLSWLLFGLGPGPGEDEEAQHAAAADDRKQAVKCDMCKDLSGGPACVRACPTGAASRVTPKDFMDFVYEHRQEATL